MKSKLSQKFSNFVRLIQRKNEQEGGKLRPGHLEMTVFDKRNAVDGDAGAEAELLLREPQKLSQLGHMLRKSFAEHCFFFRGYDYQIFNYHILFLSLRFDFV